MKVAIIGAGYAGMSAAYDLKKAGHEVTIYESASYVGGLASGFKEPHWDWSVEKFYHHWFQSDNHMLGLIKELGLDDKVIFPRPLTVMLYKDKFYPFELDPECASLSRTWVWTQQNPLWLRRTVSAPHEQLESSRKRDRRLVDDEVGG